MRAIYFPNLNSSQETVQIEGSAFHHLTNVIRIKVGDDLMLLNGKGRQALSRVKSIEKKTLTTTISQHLYRENDLKISLVIGVPKKEAFERILKICVELKIKNIYLYYSQFAQHKVQFTDRHQKILISALEQSNGYYLPTVSLYEAHSCVDYEKIILSNRVETGELKLERDKPIAFYVGPEAGFSHEEEQVLMESAQGIHLDCNILRAPTAVAAGYGFITASLV